MLRKLFYLLPPSMRFIFRRIVFLPVDILSLFSNKLVPPRGMIYTGSGDFIKQGQEWKQFFIERAALLPQDRVLDIGSGIGRIAIGLMPYLKGEYEGFDAVKTGVDWCVKNITSRNTNFRFQYIDLYNDLYKSKGRSAASFEFPFTQESFHFICAISVFTHMLADEVENYVRQIALVLKPQGKAVMTFFILDKESIEYMQSAKPKIKFNLEGTTTSALMDRKVKSANVAYQRSYLEQLFFTQGLTILESHSGYWSGRPKQIDLAFQDILIVTKV
ncbi:MAG: class I SAM-dependent methyltransferase [Saprospiraceae bacterium]|nr:class I SAM-dependent methyltransferase [Saprospiraceae bacterium]